MTAKAEINGAEAAQAGTEAPASATPVTARGAVGPRHVVEAALFSAGKPVSIEEIVSLTFLGPDTVKQAIKDLQKDYEARDTVLEVSKAGQKWAMQVRTVAAEPATKFAPPEIAKKLLKTLALIAYHQPMKQSELVDMIGSKVYEHVPELVERGLVKAREEGATKVLTTTNLFPEYFGLDAENQDEVRATLAKLVGLPPPQPKPVPSTAPVLPPGQEGDAPAKTQAVPQGAEAQPVEEPAAEAHTTH